MPTSSPVRKFIVNNLSNHQKDIIKMVVRKFGFSRQAALRHMYVLVTDGKVIVKGKTKDRSYTLKPLVKKSFSLSINGKLREDQLFEDTIHPFLAEFESNVQEICEYGFSEIMNNVLSHSKGENCTISLLINVGNISVKIEDDGLGVFKNILDHFSFKNYHRSILELAKGKLTTDSAHHSGEGIFFVSRLFDYFRMESSGFIWTHDAEKNQWAVAKGKKKTGTSVLFKISPFSNNSINKTRRKYSSNGKLVFDSTCIPVVLSKFNSEYLFSRSQAKCLTKNLNQFKKIKFDFTGLNTIGHSFADEIFRVFQQANPKQTIEWITNDADLNDLFLDIQKSGISLS